MMTDDEKIRNFELELDFLFELDNLCSEYIGELKLLPGGKTIAISTIIGAIERIKAELQYGYNLSSENDDLIEKNNRDIQEAFEDLKRKTKAEFDMLDKEEEYRLDI